MVEKKASRWRRSTRGHCQAAHPHYEVCLRHRLYNIISLPSLLGPHAVFYVIDCSLCHCHSVSTVYPVPGFATLRPYTL